MSFEARKTPSHVPGEGGESQYKEEGGHSEVEENEEERREEKMTEEATPQWLFPPRVRRLVGREGRRRGRRERKASVPRLEENLDPIQRRNRRLRHAACVRSPIPVQLSVSPLKSSEMGVTAVGPALV
jgi:hypothetical protein